MLRSSKIPSVASSGIQFDGTSATHRHFVTLCLSVYVSRLVYPVRNWCTPKKRLHTKPRWLTPCFLNRCWPWQRNNLLECYSESCVKIIADHMSRTFRDYPIMLIIEEPSHWYIQYAKHHQCLVTINFCTYDAKLKVLDWPLRSSWSQAEVVHLRNKRRIWAELGHRAWDQIIKCVTIPNVEPRCKPWK